MTRSGSIDGVWSGMTKVPISASGCVSGPPERFSGYLALNMARPWVRQRAILPNLWRQWYTAFVPLPASGPSETIAGAGAIMHA